MRFLLFLLVSLGAVENDQTPESLVRQGLTALHYFEYEEANEAFRKAQAIDPASVMACWGEAMTYHQTLWRNENVQAARQALARLGASPAARAVRATTAKEQVLLTAAETLFGDGDVLTRRARYAEAMARAYARAPDDADVAALYALALLGTMSRGLIGAGDHEGHVPSIAGSETQTRVTEILQKVLKVHPDHPGALHYLLHNDDDPAHAREALVAARALAKLAPEAGHALHMPAHIFLQLGLWTDAAASDAAAFRASDAWVAHKRLPQTLRNYHALAWLQYELLQQGRYREARATLGEIEPVVKSTGQLTLVSDLATMRARYVVETASWSMLASESNFGNVNELFAIGISAAHGGNAALAERARQALAAKQHDEREGDLRPAIAIMERELAALIAFAAGRRDEALGVLTAAVEVERKLPAPLGLPAPIKPAPELLGELLLEAGRPADAAAFFTQALERNPNRSLSVAGLARAAAARGDAAGAQQQYRQLLSNLSGADSDVPLVTEARNALAAKPTTAPLLRRSYAIGAAGVVIVVAGIAMFVVRTRSRREDGTKNKGPRTQARSSR